MLKKPLLVIKVGTLAITDKSGNIQVNILEEIVRQIIELHKTHRIVLVSSGAVGCGKGLIPKYSGKEPEQKAAAAIGNPVLMHYYQNLFSEFSDIPVAQALCERRHLSDRGSFVRLWETFQALWKIGAVVVVNENDVVSDCEVQFSDNDELATMIGVGFGAKQVLFGTSVDGIFDVEGKVIHEIKTFLEPGLEGVSKETSGGGRGGMVSKIACARKASEGGCDVVIFDVRVDGNLLRAHEHEIGTRCFAKECRLDAHQRWISLRGEVGGEVVIDEGAVKAVRDRKSLLLVGVKKFEGDFKKGDLVEVFDEDGKLVGVGRSRVEAGQIEDLRGERGVELVRTGDLVLNL